MHYVTEARHIAGHKIKVRFEDGQIKLVDLGSHLDGPIFEPLRDPAYFRRFTVNPEIDTIVWPNNADFSPDFLYEIGQEISEQSGSRGFFSPSPHTTRHAGPHRAVHKD